MPTTKIEVEKQALLVKQRPGYYADTEEFLNEYDFFIFSMSSSELMDIAKFTSRSESKFGVQRTHVEERDKQIGQFIASEHPFFPNTIIINVPVQYNDDMYDAETNTIKFTIDKESAYVIDGQHRLKAFMSKYSKGVHLQMVVVAYFGLELPTIAEIFTRINFYQKPVSKSLVYDLLDINKDAEFYKYKVGHDIVSNLNSKIGSPFYNLIKMLGVGQGIISQAAAVEAFTTRYKIIPILDSKYDTDATTTIIENYFNAIRKGFGNAWYASDSILTRSVGFYSLVKILMLILTKNIHQQDLCEFDFEPYVKLMVSVDITSLEVKTFGGFKGVNALSQKFEQKLKEKGLI